MGCWMFVFFGFINCFDVCLMILFEVVVVMDGLGDDVVKV